jgi:hypothetical protein
VWHITNRSLVASIELAHVSSDDQGFLIMDNYINDNEAMYGYDHPTLVLRCDQSVKFQIATN